MRNNTLHHYGRSLGRFFAVAAMLVPITLMSSAVATAQKMKAEDVIAKHLESLGPAAARTDAKGRVAMGTSRASFKARNAVGSIEGRAVVASLSQKAMMALVFNSPSYVGEKFGYDGKRLTIGYTTPGRRTALGLFINNYGEIFKEGLMGGTLTSTWPFLNLAERAAKLEYSGTDKINDKPVHKLTYLPKKGSDLKISIYFDATTFEHVRTQYERTIASRLSSGGIDAQARQQETRYKLTENFSDYKKEGELNLPHSYTLQLETTQTNGSSLDKWETELTEFLFNQDIDDKGWDVEAN
jgi:hypothetical protein